MPWDISESRKNKRRVVGETTHKQGCNRAAMGSIWVGLAWFLQRGAARATVAPLWGDSAQRTAFLKDDTAFSDTPDSIHW